MDELLETIEKNTITMLNKRGFSDIIRSNDMLIVENSETNKKILVFLKIHEKVTSEIVNSYIRCCNSMNSDRCIVFYNTSITPQANQTIKSIRSCQNPIYYETFQYLFMMIDITTFYLQPIFKRLSQKESAKFKAAYGVKIPVMLHTDPISRYYAYNKGDIIEVTRKDGIIYRIIR